MELAYKTMLKTKTKTKSKLKKLPKITPKQKGFCEDYLDTKNATESAEKNYNANNRNTAKSIGSENLTKPDIIEYLKNKAEDASAVVVELSNNARNEAVRLNASKDILDRSGHQAILKQEITLQPKPIIPLEEKKGIEPPPEVLK